MGEALTKGNQITASPLALRSFTIRNSDTVDTGINLSMVAEMHQGQFSFPRKLTNIICLFVSINSTIHSINQQIVVLGKFIFTICSSAELYIIKTPLKADKHLDFKWTSSHLNPSWIKIIIFRGVSTQQWFKMTAKNFSTKTMH